VVGVVDETNRRVDEDHDRGARRVRRAPVPDRVDPYGRDVMVVGYFGFILLIAFNKPPLSRHFFATRGRPKNMDL
jgi:hypothetical protein